MPEDVEPEFQSHYGKSQFSTTFPSSRAGFAVQYSIGWAVRNKDVSVCGDARVESRPLIPFGISKRVIVTRDRRTPYVEAAELDAFID